MESQVKMARPMNGYEMIMRDLGSRYRRAGGLSMVEENMAIIAVAALSAKDFGPTPATMKLSRPDLPENVKGALASYAA